MYMSRLKRSIVCTHNPEIIPCQRMGGLGGSIARTMIGLRVPTHGPNGGVADSLDEAKAAFRRAWEAAGE
jgi:hypothetical protein